MTPGLGAAACAVALGLATGACLVSFDLGPEPSICGDGVVQEGEQCDGTNLDGATCEGLGYASGGSLSCEACRLDTSGCCGDGRAAGSEACDDGNAVDWDGCTGCQVSEIQANPNPEGPQGQPDIAVSPEGDTIAVVWADADGGVMNSAWLRVFDGQGVPLTEAAVPVSPLSRALRLEHASPNVGVGPDGIIWVVFHCDGDRDGSGWGIYLQAFDRDGSQLLQDDFQVNTRTQDNQQYPRISVGGDGEVRVVWDQWNGVNRQHEVLFQRFSGDPAPEPLEQERQEVLLYGDGDQDPTMPVVGVAEDGGVLVAWKSQLGIYAVWGDADDAFSSPVRMDELGGTLGAGQVSMPAVAVMSEFAGMSGGVVAWQHTGQSGSSPVYSIQAQVILRDGSPLADGFYEFPGTVDAGMQNPGVVISGNALGSNGRAWLLWTETGGPTPLDYAQSVNPLTGTVGEPVPLGMTAQYAHGGPRAAALTSGGFVAVWRAGDQDGDDTGIFFQRFSAEGDPLGVAPAAP